MGLSDLITQLPELIGQAVEANQWLGYTAIFAAMFLENLFPPIPSELIMPLGGFYVQQVHSFPTRRSSDHRKSVV